MHAACQAACVLPPTEKSLYPEQSNQTRSSSAYHIYVPGAAHRMVSSCTHSTLYRWPFHACMQVVWAPLLGGLSVLFDEFTDSRVLRICLQGFSASCCLTAQVNSRCRYLVG